MCWSRTCERANAMGSAEISIGERIRFHRTASKKTQAVVAGLAGMSEDYLGQIERGLRTPTIDKAVSTCSAPGFRAAAPAAAATSRSR
ncbi:helix-turn-helix transcriptional regulator [Nonomuraea sp. NPDC049158]|uniref:helix-turn-helix domain-containing protein n=1 Tax=Nonomuraea sp. NPDC049158 TaxID=3155649 RepID=UPI003403CD35